MNNRSMDTISGTPYPTDAIPGSIGRFSQYPGAVQRATDRAAQFDPFKDNTALAP